MTPPYKSRPKSLRSLSGNSFSRTFNKVKKNLRPSPVLKPKSLFLSPSQRRPSPSRRSQSHRPLCRRPPKFKDGSNCCKWQNDDQANPRAVIPSFGSKSGHVKRKWVLCRFKHAMFGPQTFEFWEGVRQMFSWSFWLEDTEGPKRTGISWHLSVVYRRKEEEVQWQALIHAVQSCASWARNNEHLWCFGR